MDSRDRDVQGIGLGAGWNLGSTKQFISEPIRLHGYFKQFDLFQESKPLCRERLVPVSRFVDHDCGREQLEVTAPSSPPAARNLLMGSNLQVISI